jgi:3-hydroxybutyryl-CoA dehydratase
LNTQQGVPSTPREYCWEDLTVGLRHEFGVLVTDAMMAHFLEDSGDVNPLHVNRDFAVENGFRDRVVYGMLTASFYSTLVGVHLPGKFSLLHGIDLSFQKPVYVGDLLMVSGAVRYLNQAYRQAEIRAAISNATGVTVSTAKIRVGVLERKSR